MILRTLGVAARDGLRMYWRGALITVGTTTIALAAAMAVTSNLRATRHGLVPNLSVMTARDSTLGLPWNPLYSTTVATLQGRVLGTLAGMLIAVAIGAAAVAVITVLSVSAARAAQRVTEVNIRRAVGASRGRIAQTAFVEGTLMCIAVVTVGIAIGSIVGWVAVRDWPGPHGPLHWGPTGLAALALGFAIMIGALFTLIPSRSRTIRETTGKSPALHAAGLQLGLALLVLMMAALLVRKAHDLADSASFAGMASAGLRSGPDAGTVYRLPTLAGDEATRAAGYEAALRAFADTTQFESASLTAPGTLVGLGLVSSITTECGACFVAGMYTTRKLVNASHQFVSADTFHSLRIALQHGRNFTASDRWNSEPVVIVNTTLALRHFQDGNPLGRKLQVGTTHQWYTVIGVVDDVTPTGFASTLEPQYVVYFDVLQLPPATADLLVRARTPVQSTNQRDRIAATLDVQPAAIAPISEAGLLDLETAPLRWFGRWIGFEGWAMLLLACIGAFTLMHLWVTTLKPELGIRLATGARPDQLVMWIVLRAMLAGVGGIALAIWFAPASREAVGTVVKDPPPWDGALFARYALLLVSISLAGAIIPAWRASRSKPVALLEAADG